MNVWDLGVMAQTEQQTFNFYHLRKIFNANQLRLECSLTLLRIRL